MHGKFVWNELMTHDAAGARTFYEETAGWRFEANQLPDGGTYWIAWSGDERVGGIFEMTAPAFDNVPDMWVPYIAVADVDAALEQAKSAGASVMREPFDIPGFGRAAYIHDASRTVVALTTPQF